MKLYAFVFLAAAQQLLAVQAATAQEKSPVQPATAARQNDSLYGGVSLKSCVQYALQHQPLLQQSLLDEAIAETQIRTHLADWYPQLNLNYNIQHNFQVQTAIIGGNLVKLGVNNTSFAQFGLTQAIFNRDVLLARRTAADVRKQSKQQTTSDKIDITVNVSKAYYDVLLTRQQINLDDQAIVRLGRSLKDAYNQYQGGIVDKIDYKRATIALNNAKAQKKQHEEGLKAKFAYLKYAMGWPADSTLALDYDSTHLEKEAMLDTLQTVNFDNRIEYQLLQTQRRLLESNLNYYKWGYLPSVSAFGNYNLNYLSDDFGKVYRNNFPNSFAGISLAFPIFQGGKRIQQIRQAGFQLKRTEYDVESLRNNISAAYAQALAGYKSSFASYLVLKDNLSIAEEVYNTIQLQYKAGIKTYLDVIFAETDLRTAQVNYANALYELLSNRLEVEKQLGTIQY